ncbi:hypothetical protein OUZ56_001624 [Daphnia magna]|uniref:Uncharacterized protein n=1 Tax=Daphnia magna TaxID=35525 RepID=A0ABR0A386_9CRUS|nr:hypothetical protein OUZ56_001624 [Daphnia magna]
MRDRYDLAPPLCERVFPYTVRYLKSLAITIPKSDERSSESFPAPLEDTWSELNDPDRVYKFNVQKKNWTLLRCWLLYTFPLAVGFAPLAQPATKAIRI